MDQAVPFSVTVHPTLYLWEHSELDKKQWKYFFRSIGWNVQRPSITVRVLNGLATTEAKVSPTSIQDKEVEFSTSQVSSVPIVIPSDLVLPFPVRGLFVSWGSVQNWGLTSSTSPDLTKGIVILYRRHLILKTSSFLETQLQPKGA